MRRKIVIFNDIDGILLDSEGRLPDDINKVLKQIEELKIPLVLTSSRTRSELEFYRRKLGLFHPIISENGGGVFIPNDYFSFSFLYSDINEMYKTIELGLPYMELRKILKSIEHRLGHELRGFGDMSPEEISRICEIPLEYAKLAKMRDYEEPFIMVDDPMLISEVLDCARWAKVDIRKGSKFYYLTGEHDKGKAIKLLLDLYEKEYGDILAVGIGNKAEDIPILAQSKVAILLPLEDNTYVPANLNKTVKKIEKSGYNGWKEAVLDVISRFGPSNYS